MTAEKLRLNFSPSPAQRRAMRAFAANDITIISGDAGTGKSHAAVAAAFMHAIKTDCMITVARPVVEACGEHLGYLPGDLQQKILPYLRPIHDIISQGLVSNIKLAMSMLDPIPIAYMRGITSKGVIILDEAQNCTFGQLVLVVTRIGKGAKCVISGDPRQSDTGYGAFVRFLDFMDGIEGVEIIETDEADQQRSGVVARILEKLSDDDSEFEDRVT